MADYETNAEQALTKLQYMVDSVTRHTTHKVREADTGLTREGKEHRRAIKEAQHRKKEHRRGGDTTDSDDKSEKL